MPKGVFVWGQVARDGAILGYMMQGLTNPQIAKAMNLSPSTVTTYTRELFARLNVHTRTQAVVVAIQTGRLVVAKPDPRDPAAHRQTALRLKKGKR